MTKEINSLGEEYDWEFEQTRRKTWDELDASWESTTTTRPWDSLGVDGGWRVSTARTLNLSVDKNVNLTDKYSDSFSVFDANLKNDNVILSDVEFDSGELSFSRFKETAKQSGPVGYDEIRPLIPGEYTYKDAIVGIRMRSYAQDAKLGFYGAVHNVDVEDIVDRGTVEVTDTVNPTVVTYNKWYYNAPEELMFTVASFSEPCVVRVLTKTSEQFSIMLESTITPNKYVTGTVMWVSTGY